MISREQVKFLSLALVLVAMSLFIFGVRRLEGFKRAAGKCGGDSRSR